jgi:hypothetical protein
MYQLGNWENMLLPVSIRHPLCRVNSRIDRDVREQLIDDGPKHP